MAVPSQWFGNCSDSKGKLLLKLFVIHIKKYAYIIWNVNVANAYGSSEGLNKSRGGNSQPLQVPTRHVFEE